MKIFEKEALVLAYLTSCLYIAGYAYYEALVKGLGFSLNMFEVSHLNCLTISIVSIPILFLMSVIAVVLWDIRGVLDTALNKIVYGIMYISRILSLARWVKKKLGVKTNEDEETVSYGDKHAKKILLITVFFLIPAIAANLSVSKGHTVAKKVASYSKETVPVVILKEPKGLGTLYYLTTIGDKTICTDSVGSRLVISSDELLVIKKVKKGQ